MAIEDILEGTCKRIVLCTTHKVVAELIDPSDQYQAIQQLKDAGYVNITVDDIYIFADYWD